MTHTHQNELLTRLTPYFGRVMLCCVLSALLFVSGCGKQSFTDVEYVQKAQDSIDKGKLRDAVIYLKNALQKNPDNTQARWLLGNSYLKIHSGFAAEKELLRARNLGMSEAALIVPLAEAYLMEGKYDKVISLTAKPPALDAIHLSKVLAVRGQAFLAKNSLVEAKQALDHAISLSAKNDIATVGLSRLADREHDTARARSLLVHGIKLMPDSYRLHAAIGELDLRQSRFREADAAFSSAIKRVGFNGFYYLQRAEARLHLGQLKQANADIALAARSVSASPQYFYTRGLYRLFSGHYASAQGDLEKSLNLYPGNLATIFYLGACHVIEGHLAQAEQYLGQYLSQVPNSLPANIMMASIYARTARAGQARGLLDKVLQARPDNIPALRMMGQTEMLLGDSDKALEYYRRLVSLQPKSSMSRTELGMQLVQSGDTVAGLDQLDQAIAIDPGNLTADVYRVLIALRNDKPEQALSAARHAVKLHPDSAVAYNLMGLSYQKKGDMAQAVAAFEKALELSATDPAAAIYLANIDVTEKKYAAASSLYHRVLSNRPGHIVATLQLAKLKLLEKDSEGARLTLENTLQLRPDALQVRMALVQIYLQKRRYSQALTLLNEAPDEPGLHAQPYLALLAESQLLNGQYKAAIATFTALNTIKPLAVYDYGLAQAYLHRSESAKAKSALMAAVKRAPQFLPAQIALVRLLVDEGDLRAAQARMTTLRAAHPKNPELLAQSGWLALRANRPHDAIVDYRAALAITQDSAMTRDLALAYWAAGQHAEAVQTLSAWSAAHPNDWHSLENLANLELMAGQYTAATQHFSEVVAHQPGNVAAINNLAWLLRKRDPARALKLATRAVSLDSSFAPALDTQGMLLLEAGQAAQALSSLRAATKQAPDDPGIRYHWIQALHAVGKTQEAKLALGRLLKQKKKFEERAAAVKFYKTL